MLKKLSCFGIGAMLLVALSGCGENGKNVENVTDGNDYSWFITDSYHCNQPGAWGGGMPDMYYFASDNTYSWTISDYTRDETVVAKKGTWKIENGKLVLHEEEETYLEGGKVVEVKDNPIIGDGNVLIDYTVANRTVDNTVEKTIEYVGVSEYAENTGRADEYEYKLGEETMYTNVPVEERSINDWLEMASSFED